MTSPQHPSEREDYPLPTGSSGAFEGAIQSRPAPEPGKQVEQEPGFRSRETVEKLLESLQRAEGGPTDANADPELLEAENRLTLVRLGIATSLYYALRTKHPPTAAHSLRVALFCSSWAERMGLEDELRDRIEVASLLHDIGKIGIPDRVLRKPGKLTVDEQLSMDTCPHLGCAILRGCTSDQELLSIVRYSTAWYEGRRDDDTPKGDLLPLGARMLAIADAFDAMTTEHVYRPAMSCERAIAELVRGSGTQFDPGLIIDFSRLLEEHPEVLQGGMVHRWLQQLRPKDSESFWTAKEVYRDDAAPSAAQLVVRNETLFNQQLLRTLKDGVAFTDQEGMIIEWNLALERLTDVPPEAIIGKQFSCAALRMRNADRKQDEVTDCPMQECFRTGTPVRRAMVIESPGAAPISVHVEVAPVTGSTPGSFGTVIVVHDLSDRENLERRLEKLHKETTLDPLTRLANRSHFDDTLDEMVAKTASGGPTFSLIICDIDHFKSINDTYGHPAGDEALQTFADLLRSHSREADLVARYGGEEFLLLAASCDNATGAKRAEVLRQALEVTPIGALDGKCLTASFGVTEYQSGDSAKTILSRSDRALLKAKDNGRNRVVQLGLGKMSEYREADQTRGSWFSWFSRSEESSSSIVDILTPVPIDLAIQKIRGFIADHEAEILSVAENQLSIRLNSGAAPNGRRRQDHRITFVVKMTLSSATPDELEGADTATANSTKVHLEFKPIRNRDRRRRDLKDAAQLLISSFRCYLMGEVIHQEG